MANHERETSKSSKPGKSGKSASQPAKSAPAPQEEPREEESKLPKKAYEAELFRLQAELVKVQA